jgi:hypothetical protein
LTGAIVLIKEMIRMQGMLKMGMIPSDDPIICG